VCHADALDRRRVAKDDWRAGEAVEESNSGAEKNRRDVDVDFVEESSIHGAWISVHRCPPGSPAQRRDQRQAAPLVSCISSLLGSADSFLHHATSR
jgi:hypothetical protein